jgi:hypothetical protein
MFVHRAAAESWLMPGSVPVLHGPWNVRSGGEQLETVEQPQTLVPAPMSVQALVMPSVMSLERSVKARRDQDVPFMNWWLATLIVTPVTLYIYGIVIWFKLLGRVNAFHLRRRQYYDAVVDFTAKYADAEGKAGEVQEELRRLRLDGVQALETNVPVMNPWLQWLLSIVTVGIWGLVVMYRLNKAWYTFETIEQTFDDNLSQAWAKLGLAKYPLAFNVDARKKRGFGLYLLLSVVTLGIWGIVWNYKIYTDPDNIYSEFHGVEDVVLQTARAA